MMNKQLRLAVRNADCSACRMRSQAEGDSVCVTGSGPNGAKVVIVTKFPAGGRTKSELDKYLTEAGFNPDDLMWCSAMKCRTWDLDPNKTDQKACRPYLTAELDFIKPDWVLVFGGEALMNATGKAKIMENRGKIFDHPSGAKVFATISPSMIARNPGLTGGFLADLKYFYNLTTGQTGGDPDHVPGPSRETTVDTKDRLRDTLAALDTAVAVAYDVETTRGSEFESASRIVSLSMTTVQVDGDMSTAHVWKIPLYHPDSPWLSNWQQVVKLVGKHIVNPKRRIAHNAKFDTRWMVHFGAGDLTPTFDTIIAASLLDENRPKGLKPLAQHLLSAEPWGIDVSKVDWWLEIPLPDILTYNGLDTWHTMRLYYVFRTHLIQQPRLARLFTRLMMPAVCKLVTIERRGVWTDADQLAINWGIAEAERDAIEQCLTQWLPEDDNDIPDGFWSRRDELDVNWNPSNFLRWFVFDWLEMPVMERGKTKDDGTPGDPSVKESVMMELADKHEACKLLLDRVEWNKFCTSFFAPYTDQLTPASRIHTTFKPWGTVTGRLSSGKEDAEKITSKAQRRGVNLQQVPRNPLVRGVFGAPPGSSFVEADYSQVELRVAAFIAREDTMLHLYATGQDIHTTMAMQMTGKPKDAVTKDERKKAKAVNFGFLYGMGWNKFISTAWENYGVRVTEEEAKAFRQAFFRSYPLLMRWHAKQRRMAHKFGRVETPMGRIRHLPDIYSPIDGVRAEAERQAINSPVQAMASDMALLAMVLIDDRFLELGLTGHPIGTVHDAINFEIPHDELAVALPVIKDTMENLPLHEFGVTMDVPIVADLKVGARWGNAREIPATDVYNWKPEMVNA